MLGDCVYPPGRIWGCPVTSKQGTMSEHDGARKSIPEQGAQLVSELARSASNVSTVATLVKKSYTDMPTSERAVGTRESEALVEAREQMTKKLVLYGGFHLPLSAVVVNDLVRTLDYFKKDFDQFKSVLKFVRKQVKNAEVNAEFVHEMYVTLGTDLKKLGEDASKALKVAMVAAQDEATTAKSRALDAKSAGEFASGAVGGAVGAGLFFAPYLTIPAVAAGATTAVAGTSVTVTMAAILRNKSNQTQRVADALMDSYKVYETIFGGALGQFADCVKGFADFFQSIGCKLGNVDANMKDLDEGFEDASGSFEEDELRGLYNVIQGQADELREALNLYVSNSTQAKIDIGLLKLLEDEKYPSYIDEWYKTCRSDRKSMGSTKNLLMKALPDRAALHQ